MGWTYTEKQKGQPVEKFFRERFEWEEKDGGIAKSIIGCATVNLSEVYIAYEIINRDENTREVVAVVCLVHFVPKSEFNFGYKDMDETMGPGAVRCPEKILNMLTPTKNENALAWRKECRERLAKTKARPGIRQGDVLVFPKEIEFTNGIRLSRLTAVDPRRNKYRSDNGMCFKLRRNTVRNGTFEINRNGEIIRAGNAA